ncbi:hypothetical protein [Paraburkholderia sp. C35]|uniref:hypothetical protein n=1 Tax=Paraburkholderia sp. C35 TaxID=2126993 RepID=UPI000D6994AC|nr:hypothetical protein [Paraburkholderia sp. C35]
MFEYERQLTRISHINVGQEKHGNQDVNAMDIDLRYTTSNQVLAMFAPTLKSTLFEKEDSPQQEVNPDAEHMTVVRHPKMGPIKWDDTYENASVTVHIGASGKADITFGDCKVRKFVIEPKQGGTVVVSYQVRCHPSDEQIGKIAGKLNQEVFVTLDPEAEGGSDDEAPDTGKGANEIADRLKKARGRKKQTELID